MTSSLINRRIISILKDLTRADRSQWLEYLSLRDHKLQDRTNDWFNPKYADTTGYFPEIWIDEYDFNGITIKEMYGWKDENIRVGAVFIGESPEIAFITGGCIINDPYASGETNYSGSPEVQQFRKQIKEYYELRKRYYPDSLELHQKNPSALPLKPLIKIPTLIPPKGEVTTLNPELYLPTFGMLSTFEMLPTLGSASNFVNTIQPLSLEVIERMRREERERMEKERKHIHEFDFVSRKYIKSMADFTMKEIWYWMNYLESVGFLPPEELKDFFNDDYWDGHVIDIVIYRWKWTHNGKTQNLIEICGWKRAEVGAIFMDNKIVFEIGGDSDVMLNEETPKDLVERLEAYSHIRKQHCQDEEDYDDNHPAHKWCEQIHNKMDY